GASASITLTGNSRCRVTGTLTSTRSIARLAVDGVDVMPTILSAAQTDMQTGTGNWSPAGASIARAEESGVAHLVLTSGGSGGDIRARTPEGVNAVPCKPGQAVAMLVEAKSDAASRSFRAGFVFFDASGAQLTELLATAQ